MSQLRSEDSGFLSVAAPWMHIGCCCLTLLATGPGLKRNGDLGILAPYSIHGCDDDDDAYGVVRQVVSLSNDRDRPFPSFLECCSSFPFAFISGDEEILPLFLCSARR